MTTTVDAFLELYKDPTKYAAKMAEFSAAEKAAADASAQAVRDLDEAAKMQRASQGVRAQLDRDIREFERNKADAEDDIRSRRERLDELRAETDRMKAALIDERSKLHTERLNAQQRETDAKNREHEASQAAQDADAKRKQAGNLIAALKGVMQQHGAL